MAYVYSGSMVRNITHFPPYNTTDNPQYVTNTAIFLDKGFALFAKVRNEEPPLLKRYFLVAIPKNNKHSQYTFEVVNRGYTNTGETVYENSRTKTANVFPDDLSLFDTYDKTYNMFDAVQTTIPLFDYYDTDSINAYINNGDTSGAIKDASTKWNLYIDGTKNPLYKLTWDCADIPTSDISRVKVMFCGYDETATAYIVKDTQY